MWSNKLSLCISVLVLFCALHTCESLKCYHCNITSPIDTKGDPCKGHEQLQQCQEPAICLQASYSYEVSSTALTKSDMKTCYPNMAGKECEIFLKNIRHPTGNTMGFSESCVTCSDDGCNTSGDSGSPGSSTASNVSALFILSVVSLVSKMLL